MAREDDRTDVPGVMYATDALGRDQAREVWARRERELRPPETKCPAPASPSGGLTRQDQLGFQGAGSRVRVSVQR